MAAAHTADAMVPEHTVMIPEGWLIQQRREPIGKVPWMNQHNRLPVSPDFVLKFNVLEGCPIHAPWFHDLPPCDQFV
jgi:hypothetical protein